MEKLLHIHPAELLAGNNHLNVLAVLMERLTWIWVLRTVCQAKSIQGARLYYINQVFLPAPALFQTGLLRRSLSPSLAACTLPICSEAKSSHLEPIIILPEWPRVPQSRSVLPHVRGFGALPFSQSCFFGELTELLVTEKWLVGAKVVLTCILRPLPSGLFSAVALSALLHSLSMHDVFHAV